MRTPLQILFLILVTDLPPSIALGMEPGDGEILQTEIKYIPDYENKLMDARTVAFISLVWSENVRSYTSRSFQNPVWVNFLGNATMQKAIVLAQAALYAAVLVPFFSDKILGLRGFAVGFWGWGVALLGPIGCIILCELCKLITAYQSRMYQKQLAEKRKRMEEAAAGGALTTKQKSAKQLTSAVPDAVARKVSEKPVQQPSKKGSTKAKKGCFCVFPSWRMQCVVGES